jgi:hypothetical protein
MTPQCAFRNSNVSGVAIVAISRKAARPTRYAPGRQSAAIVITETQSLLPELPPQEPVFFDQVRDRLPLTAIQPAREHA